MQLVGFVPVALGRGATAVIPPRAQKGEGPEAPVVE